MLRAGVPLLQAFDIVARGHSNARFSRLMLDIKGRIEAGSSLSQAFREHPAQFDSLYCNLVSAGGPTGCSMRSSNGSRPTRKRSLAIKSKIKSALFYPISVIVVAIVVVWVIMIWVIPAFKQVFTSFGADLPAPTLMVMAISDFFVDLLVADGDHRRPAALVAFFYAAPKVDGVRYGVDRISLRFRSSAASWKRRRLRAGRARCATMFAAGVPLVESLDAVAGASGNSVYAAATKRIQTEVSTGASLTNSMPSTKLFPSMVLQMTQIGEESGSLDGMLSKIAEFYERGGRRRGVGTLQPARADHHRLPRASLSAAWSSRCICRSSSWVRVV